MPATRRTRPVGEARVYRWCGALVIAGGLYVLIADTAPGPYEETHAAAPGR